MNVQDLRLINIEVIRHNISVLEGRAERMEKDKNQILTWVLAAFLLAAASTALIFWINPDKMARGDFWNEVLVLCVLGGLLIAMDEMCNFFIRKNQEILDNFYRLLEEEESTYVKNLPEVNRHGERKVSPVQARA